jgi:hypothetical protein
MSFLDLVLYALPFYCAPATLAATMPEGISSSNNLVALMSTNITSTHDLAKRDPCAYEPEPILYHEYSTDACLPRFHLKPNGQCEDDPDASFFCASFCNIRTNFFYTLAQPFLASHNCLGQMKCTISESVQQSWGWKAKLNLNFNIRYIKGGVRLTSSSFFLCPVLTRYRSLAATAVPLRQRDCPDLRKSTLTLTNAVTSPYRPSLGKAVVLSLKKKGSWRKRALELMNQLW